MIVALIACLLLSLTLVLWMPFYSKPLSEDDGNWYYYPVFRKKGIELYKNYFYYGYYNIPKITSWVYSIVKPKSFNFFYIFKAVWTALTAVSIFILTYLYWGELSISIIASILFVWVSITPATLFTTTYSEHMYLLPINLAMICIYYSFHGGSTLYLLAAGLLISLVMHLKQTCILVFGYFTLALLVASCPVLGLFLFVLGFLVLLVVPICIIKSYGGNVLKYKDTFRYVVLYIKKTYLNVIRKFQKTTNEVSNMPKCKYTDQHIGRTREELWKSFRNETRLIFKCFRLLLFLAFGQLFVAVFSGDIASIFLFGLMVVHFLIYYIQKNFYPTYFNPVFSVAVILAAKTIFDLWSFEVAGQVWIGKSLSLVLASYFLFEFLLTAYENFKEENKDKIGEFGPGISIVWRLAETVGLYIKKKSSADEKLLVWGSSPTVYLYSNRLCIDTKFLFLYSKSPGLIYEDALMESIKTTPPDWLFFFNYKYPDDWNMQKLSEITGLKYKEINSWTLTFSDAKNTVLKFPLYRLCKDSVIDKLRIMLVGFGLEPDIIDRLVTYYQKNKLSMCENILRRELNDKEKLETILKKFFSDDKK